MIDATPFEGRSSALRKSPWMSCEDIDGIGEVEVTIEAVGITKEATMQDGRKESNIPSIKFVGKERRLVLNATNRKTLYLHFGGDTKKWVGQKIKLHVKDGVRCPTGGTTKGIRIK